LTVSRDDAAEDPDVYFAFAQFPPLNFDIIVRQTRPGTITSQMIQQAVNAADPTIPIFHVQTLAGSLAAQTASARFGSFVLGIFALLALTLGAVGLYGVTMFIVSARRRDLAIRLALGAEPARMVRDVVVNGLIVAVTGAAIGIAGAFAATRLLGSFLYGVTPTDPLTFIIVSLLLIGTAAIANLMPALRAARIDPQMALRAD
jgi:ABC-type antimicrobial peptide transport system permease subunit